MAPREPSRGHPIKDLQRRHADFNRPTHTRHLLNQKFLQALLLNFEAHGRDAIEECRKQSPLGYVKVLGHLVPREMKVEYSQNLKSMSDERARRGD
jgi:hypothetical protein